MESFRVKAAFLGGAMAAAKRFAPQIGSKLLTRGMGKESRNQAMWGAGIGGALEGGLGALTAGEGHRMEGFGRGALHGAVAGGAMGGMSGAVSAPLKNLRTQGLMAAGYTPRQAVGAVRQGYGKTLKNALGFGDGKIPRGAAAIEAVAAPAQLAAEMAIPAAAMGVLEGPQKAQLGQPLPESMRVASAVSQPPMTNTETEPSGAKFEPVYIAPFTSTTGAGTVDALLDHFAPMKGGQKPGFLRKRALPALGAAALTIPAVKAIRALNPEPEPLQDIDVDALKQYFGKTPQ